MLRRRGLIGLFPIATLTILIGCLVGFVTELSFEHGLDVFLQHYGFVQLQVAAWIGGVDGTSSVRSVLPFFTSLFFHSGLFHLLLNIWYLWMLGDVLEAWLGSVRYAALFFVGAGVQTLTGLVVAALSGGDYAGVPSVGISGAVAGLIGGYAVVLIVLFRKRDAGEEGARLLWLPMALGLLCWFPLQWLNRVLSLPAATYQNSEPVPWISLFASAAVGALVVGLTRPRQRIVAEVSHPHEEEEHATPEHLEWEI